MRATLRTPLVVTLVSSVVAALLPVITATSPAAAAPADGRAVPVYPPVGPSTRFLDHSALLGDAAEPAWYEANIPFVDLPDKEIQDTYYYRWRVYKEALKYTGPDDGWIVSEFLGPVGYSAPLGGINAAAGHHIYEGRWLRDRRYVDDYLDYWLRGTGSREKPPNDGKGITSTDWAHQYSFWAVDAAVARASVTGDWDYLLDRLPELRGQYEQWKGNFDERLGLYWQTPVWDAMEFTASSYQSDDPYHGGEGFRSTINAYQYGDARALAALLRRAGDGAAASRYDAEADRLRAAQERWLWDADEQFYKHVMRDGNPAHEKLNDREQIGFIPWYFHMAPARNAAAWAQLTDPSGFAAPYGPTTVERRSEWFMHDALLGCCRWSGPSWPYATSQTLTGLANLLLDYPAQPYVDRGDFYDVLRGYALSQRKDRRPYVAEAHHPDEDRWLYDARNHSEDYNHSTFNDIVLSGLLGIRPQQGEKVRIAPLAPGEWNHFAVENVPYHGRNLTVLWDRDGSVYGQGAGLRVWLDGRQVHSQRDLTPVEVRVPTQEGPGGQLPELVDDLANVSEIGYPTARASYTWRGDKAVDAVDGQDFHLDVPSTRWTTWSSPNPQDWLEVDFGAPTSVSDLRVVFYDDGGGVRAPTSYAVQYQAPDGTWSEVPGQERLPARPVGRAVNRVLVDPPVVADRLRVVPVREGGGAVGITSLQSWRKEDPAVTAAFVGLSDDVLQVRPGASVEVKTVVTADRMVPAVSAQLLAPRGWTVKPTSAARVDQLVPGRALRTTWQVTAPEELALGAELPLRLLVSSGGRHGGLTGALARARWTFNPADFPTTAWDDDFSTDRRSEYRIDRPSQESVPALSVADGALRATATGRSWVFLAAPVRGSTGGTAVIVQPRSFAGTSTEDSIFLGQSAGANDFAMAWYNNHFDSSGVDVRRDGANRSDAAGGCCADARWQPGDRFAVVLRAGTLTSWHEHGGAWRLLRSAPVGVAVDPTTLASWSPALGLRLEPGTISLDRLTVLTG